MSTHRPQPAAYHTITSLQAITPLDTKSLFVPVPPTVTPSPIDQFIANTNAINRIYLAATTMHAELGTLVLLGYMSAVESFFRALIRGLINVDVHTRLIAEPLAVSFGV